MVKSHRRSNKIKDKGFLTTQNICLVHLLYLQERVQHPVYSWHSKVKCPTNISKPKQFGHPSLFHPGPSTWNNTWTDVQSINHSSLEHTYFTLSFFYILMPSPLPLYPRNITVKPEVFSPSPFSGSVICLQATCSAHCSPNY